MSEGARPAAAARQIVKSLQRCGRLSLERPPFGAALGDYHQFPRPSPSPAAAAAAAATPGGREEFDEGIVIRTPVSWCLVFSVRICLLFFRGLVPDFFGVLRGD
jgi:transcription factor E2F3